MEARSPRPGYAAAILCAASLAAGPASAAAPPEGEADRLVKAASAYIAVWDVDGRAACEERRPACEHMEELLDRAARALSDAHRTGAAILVFRTLLDPRYHLDHTDRGRMAPYEIGAAYQSIGAYAEAATLFERFAEEREALDQAPPSLEEAARIRLRLGQREKAISDLALFQRLYARKQPDRLSRIALGIAAGDEAEEDYTAELGILTAAMPGIDRSAPLETRIEAHARMGRALAGLGRGPGAAIEMSRVLVIARDRALAAQRKRGKDPAPDPDTDEVIAEARFFQAEQKREEVLKIKLLPYRGGGDRASVLAYFNTQVSAFVTQKEAAIWEAQRAYERVLGRDPPPVPPPTPRGGSGSFGLLGRDPNAPRAPADPPRAADTGALPSVRWAIAAASRVGSMWGDYLDQIAKAPSPRDLAPQGLSPEDVRRAYEQTLDSAQEVRRQQAKQAFKMCLDLSIKNARFDDFSRACEAWLAKHYRAEHHALEELYSGPRWISAGPIPPPAPAIPPR